MIIICIGSGVTIVLGRENSTNMLFWCSIRSNGLNGLIRRSMILWYLAVWLLNGLHDRPYDFQPSFYVSFQMNLCFCMMMVYVFPMRALIYFRNFAVNYSIGCCTACLLIIAIAYARVYAAQFEKHDLVWRSASIFCFLIW